MHAWHNPGPGWAHWVSVLVDAETAIVEGVALEAEMRGTEQPSRIPSSALESVRNLRCFR